MQLSWRRWCGERVHWEGILLLTLLSYLAYQRLYLPSADRLRTAEAREAALRTELRELRGRLAALENERDALAMQDPATVEEAIRTELGWGSTGEVRFTPAPSAVR